MQYKYDDDGMPYAPLRAPQKPAKPQTLWVRILNRVAPFATLLAATAPLWIPGVMIAHAVFATPPAMASTAPHKPATPAWLHWAPTSHRDHGKPCVVVWGGSGSTSALVCKSGKAYTS